MGRRDVANAEGRVMIPRLLSAVVLSSALAGRAAAQIAIHVVDPEGHPVPAVRIDVLGSAELIGVYATSAQGFAELSPERWSEVRRISLSHLGFPTLIVQAGDIPTDGVILLEPQATEIEGFTVEARELCPIADDPEARRLWSEVASLYASTTGTRSWLAYLSVYGGSVREDDLHRTSDSESVDYVAAGGPGVIHGGDHTPRSLDERISSEGYAWPPLVIAGTTSGREVAWRYAELDRTGAHHFASRAFGVLHDFAVASASEGRATLVFCGNGEGSGATINGTISVVPGEAFVAAEWRFETDDPDEGAGGSVSFTSYVDGPGSKPHLVASRGLFYRHSGTEPPYPDLPRTYGRWVTAKVRWHLNPTGERPCNTGLSFHGDPPPPTDSDGVRFAACVREHWGRR
jgi:hypothetical protein